MISGQFLKSRITIPTHRMMLGRNPRHLTHVQGRILSGTITFSFYSPIPTLTFLLLQAKL